MKTNNRNLEFLFEIGCLRFLPRMWQRFLGPNVADVAAHSFRTIWTALMLAQREEEAGGVPIDREKVVLMALVHDIAESRTGDVDYLMRQYVERNEALAIEDMLGGTSLYERMKAVWSEYEQRESREAKLVKDADSLDVDLELQEQRWFGWYDYLHTVRKENVQPKLYTQAARELFEEIAEANPHSWHMHGRNRHNAGDWKK